MHALQIEVPDNMSAALAPGEPDRYDKIDRSIVGSSRATVCSVWALYDLLVVAATAVITRYTTLSDYLPPGADPGQGGLPEPRKGWRLTGRPNTVKGGSLKCRVQTHPDPNPNPNPNPNQVKGGFLKYSLNDERLMGPHVQVSYR